MTELERFKQYKIGQIEKKTEDLVNLGMRITGRPEGTIILPLDLQHRQDFELIKDRSDQVPSWPIAFADRTKLKLMIFVDVADLSNVLDDAFTWGFAIHGDGTTLAIQVVACSTVEQVLAIQDTREWEDYN
jgi:hypothetical protein